MNSVKIIAKTQPIAGPADATDLISYCARVSNPSNQENYETSEQLLTYCAEHSHWSVFEQANVTFKVETTRDISRQMLRHWTLRPQEFSQRYADPTTMGYVIREARLQDTKNRQNSLPCTDVSLAVEWEAKQREVYELALKNYKWAIDNNIAKEQARVVLPEGMTKSVVYFNGNLRSWIHYCSVRKANGTQKEHVDIADKIWSILKQHFTFLEKLDD